MIKIRITYGFFKKQLLETTIYHEDCKTCDAGELFYPSSVAKPTCPRCKTVLRGSELGEDNKKRTIYHLEK